MPPAENESKPIAAPERPASPGGTPDDRIIEVIAEISRYPRELLKPEADLEEDLGFDEFLKGWLALLAAAGETVLDHGDHGAVLVGGHHGQGAIVVANPLQAAQFAGRQLQAKQARDAGRSMTIGHFSCLLPEERASVRLKT